MSKEALKQRRVQAQEGACALSGATLPEEARLFDTDRVLPKVEGGTYVDEQNVRAVDPVAHMERHGTLRRREEQLETLKSTFDDRVQTMKLLLKINNQVLACERRVDHRLPDTEAFLHEQMEPINARLKEIDRSLGTQIKEYEDPLARTAIGVLGLGPITVAALTVYVDLGRRACPLCKRDIHRCEAIREMPAKDRRKDEKVCVGDGTTIDGCSSPSALWKYVGLHCSSHERYKKGVAGGGNKTLRTVLWNSANVMMKLRASPYREVYDRTKERLAISEKIVKSCNTQGKIVEVAWKDAKPCHRHGAALRAIVKHLLVDYWLIGRELQGLPTRTIYAEAMLGHTHITSPKERGWE